MGAICANDFSRQANGYGQADDDHPSPRTDPDEAERLDRYLRIRCSPTGSVRDIRGMTVATATRTAAYVLVTHGVLSRAAVACKTVGS